MIHDLHTDAEAEWLRGAGGFVIYLRREGVAYRKDHSAECEPAPLTGDLVLDDPEAICALRGALLGLLVDVRQRQAK